MSRLSQVLCVLMVLAAAGAALAEQAPALTSFSFPGDVAQAEPAEAACCNAGCVDCCAPCCCCPTWTVEAGAVLLERVRDNDRVLMTDMNGGVLLDASEFDTDVEGGPMVRLLRHRPCGPDLELSFFTIGQFSDAAVYPAFPDGTRFIVQEPNPFYFNGNTGPNPVAFRSELYSTELNARWCANQWLTVLAGFRWVELHEQINWDFRFDTIGCRTRVNGGNHMYGFQLGADAALWRCGRLRLDGLLKAGAYGNWASATSAFEQPRGAQGWGTADRDGVVSFLGEVDLTAKYRLSPSVQLAAGYQVMWMEGVALASQQLSALNVPYSGHGIGDGIDTSGSPFYHGALVSLIYTR